MFDEDLAIKRIIGTEASSSSTNILDVIRAYAEVMGTEIDYVASLQRTENDKDGICYTIDKNGSLLAKSKPSCDNCDYCVIIGNEQDNNELYLQKSKFAGNGKEVINGRLIFPDIDSVLLVRTDTDMTPEDLKEPVTINYYNSESCDMARKISGTDDVYEMIRCLEKFDYIKPDSSFSSDYEHFAETFKEATELVKAPETKHM